MNKFFLALGSFLLASNLLAQEVSRNAVGFSRQSLPGGGLYLAAANFNALGSVATVSNICLVGDLPVGSAIWLWDAGAGASYRAEIVTNSGSGASFWSPGTNLVGLGQSFWVEAAGVSSSNYAFFLAGEVPSNAVVSVSLGAGLQFVAYGYPVSSYLRLLPNLLAAVDVGDRLWSWNTGAGKYSVETCLPGGTGGKHWYPGTLQLTPGMGFILQKARAGSPWTEGKPYVWP